MNQTKSLPAKYYGENGIHRVPLWRVAGFALNNASTNLYMFLMTFVAYYLGGWVGVGTVLAGSFSMAMRLWDCVTDPLVGFLLDKTNGKFGKNRPFMLIGNVILFAASWVLFNVTHLLPEAARFPFFIVISAVYYIGYTFQCVVTKSAQTCLTNDPKQRPLFALFDGVYLLVIFTILQFVAVDMAEKYGGFTTDPRLYSELQLILGAVSAIFMVIALISIAPKDRMEFYGTGKPTKIRMRDYLDTLLHNRAIQMLVVSAGTDKLASTMHGSTTMMIVLLGVVVGDYGISGTIQGIVSIPSAILMMLFVGGLATRLGQRKAMLIGSWGGIITNLMLAALWLFGDYKSMSAGAGVVNWGFFTIAYVVLNIVMSSFTSLSGNIVIPMTADCADYEVYRTGRYVPGLMGTLFSFVDKIISSFAPMLMALMYAAIGFKDVLPDLNATFSNELFYTTLFIMYGVIVLGNLCNVIAMKFYPLTKEKMAQIQSEIDAIKQKAQHS